jgi:DNA modification methylase
MEAYYRQSAVTLYHGDCIDVLRTMPNASVDAVVTDPPYGQTNEAYDCPVAFNPTLWRECCRVAKPNAALVAFAGSRTYRRIATAVEAGEWEVRQMWAWVYRDGMITSAYPREGFDRLAPAMDPIVYATKGKVLLRLEREGDKEWRRGYRQCNLSARSNGDTATTTARGHWPKSLVSDGVEPFEYFVYRRAKADPDTTGHPNQKPLTLMRWLVGDKAYGRIARILVKAIASASTSSVSRASDAT